MHVRFGQIAASEGAAVEDDQSLRYELTLQFLRTLFRQGIGSGIGKPPIEALP